MPLRILLVTLCSSGGSSYNSGMNIFIPSSTEAEIWWQDRGKVSLTTCAKQPLAKDSTKNRLFFSGFIQR